jgi:hypothetical protein
MIQLLSDKNFIYKTQNLMFMYKMQLKEAMSNNSLIKKVDYLKTIFFSHLIIKISLHIYSTLKQLAMGWLKISQTNKINPLN